ncbi:MAG: carbon storage regulator [Bryobacteraceae bacterium]
MLVMRRRQGESILIGDDVEIQIIQIGPTRIKIGITAPKAVPVTLKEIKLVRQENLAAARLPRVNGLAGMFHRLAQEAGSRRP